MQDSDNSNEHQQQSPPRPKTSKKLTGAATYRTKFSSIWVSHYRVLFEVERSACCIRKEVGGGGGGLVVAWSCGLVVKALVAHASDPGSIPGDSRFFTSFLS